MKRTRTDKLVILAGAILSEALLLSAALYAAFPECLAASKSLYDRSTAARAAVIVAAIALIALVAVKTWRAFFPGEGRAQQTVSLDSVEGGAVQVSLTALEAMARRAVGEQPGVRELDVFLTEGENGLKVKLDMKVDSSVRVPELTGRMQASVKDAVESFTGMTISDVTVLVSDIVAEQPGR